MPLVTITAWEGLVDRAHVRAGQTVLIHAGGAAWTYAIQIARAKGAEVFASVSANKSAIVRDLGATPSTTSPSPRMNTWRSIPAEEALTSSMTQWAAQRWMHPFG